MHKSSMLRMRWFVDNYLVNNSYVSVLDVGSYDHNGTYKQIFDEHYERFRYTGLDMVSGPNVNVVPKNTYKWHELSDESFDVIISGQAFEHIEFFWLTMDEIVRVLKRGGLICIVAPREWAYHPAPVDCYRFDIDGMAALAKYEMLEILHTSCNLAPPGTPSEWYMDNCADSMLVAKKPEDWSGKIDPASYVFTPNDYKALTSGFITKDKQVERSEFGV